MPQAKAVMESIAGIEYKLSPWLEFTPKDKIVTKGLIFYPGGKVAPEAYSPLAEKIAQEGIKVVIVPMPFNLAVFSPNEAANVIGKYPEIKQWDIAGYSRWCDGGTIVRFGYNSRAPARETTAETLSWRFASTSLR